MKWSREHSANRAADKQYDALRDLPDWLAPQAEEVLGELFDNARRAGATRIDVTIGPNAAEGCEVRVADDGNGIADPQVLGIYGETGWPKGTPGLPPTGKGLFRLAAGTLTIASRPAANAPWRARLAPGTLTDDHALVVEAARGTTTPGTRVSWQTPDIRNERTWKAAASAAGQLMPIPVMVNGSPVSQTHPLSGAIRRTTVDGVVVGIFGPCPYPAGGDDIADHGRRLQGRLPSVSMTGNDSALVWYVRAMITSEATIRAERTSDSYAIRNDPRLRRLGAKVRKLLYEQALAHMTASGIGIHHHDWERAEMAGATRGQPLERLTRWGGNNIEIVRHGSAVLDAQRIELDQATRATLKRALTLNGEEPAIMDACESSAGYPWYRALPHVTEIWVAAESSGVRRNTALDRPGRHQAEAIEVVIEVETGDGWESRQLLPTDMAASKVQGQIGDTEIAIVTTAQVDEETVKALRHAAGG